MDWFRMYSEFASDPKVQSMSEAMQRRLMMLLCLRCSNTLVTLQDDEIAFALRITDEDLIETKALFIRKGFIDETWDVLNWDKRQFVSDSSAVRVARHRAKKKEGPAVAKAEVKQACNVTVTPQNRTDTEQNRTENKTNVEPTPLDVSVAKPPDDITEIFAFWKKVMLSPGSVLDDKRRRAIRSALKNYSPADLCKAIRGCSKSPFHMGVNAQKTKYNGITLILRSAEYIDKFIEFDRGDAATANETIEQRNERIARMFLGEELDDMTIEMES